VGAFDLTGYLFGGFGEPGLQVRADRCLRASGSDCRACVEICPAEALRLGPPGSTEAPQSERSRCTDCGLCAATCPSGAITGVGAPPGALTREAGRHSSAMSVVCSLAPRERPRSEEDPPFPVSCLAALHPETVVATSLALQPGATLTLTRTTCSGCPGAQQARVTSVVQESVDLLQRLDGGGRMVVLAIASPSAPHTKQPPPTKQPPDTKHDLPERSTSARRRGWSRRELLTGGRSGARVASGPAVTPARAELLSYSADPSSVPVELIHPVDGQGCTFCHACAAVCPTQALRIGRRRADTEQGDGTVPLQLAVDPARCVGCGRCAEVCVDDLLALGHGLGQAWRGQSRVGRLVVLAEGKRSTCERCKQPLSPHEQGVCRRCDSSRTLIAGVLAL